jgi:predicted permease
MLSNYFSVALRKLAKHRDYALLNGLGLGLSIGCSILIFMFLRHHLGFDRYHRHAERVVRVLMDVKTEQLMPFPGVPLPMSQTLREECALLEKTAMYIQEDVTLVRVDNASGSQDKYKEESKLAWVEPEILQILDLELLQGDAAALSEPNTVLLSETLAHKYFGKAEAIGKILHLDMAYSLRVAGILRDPPQNTDYKAQILASWSSLKATRAELLKSWAGASGDNLCLGLLQPGKTLGELQQYLRELTQKKPHPEAADLFQYRAMSMLDLHFDTDYGFGMDKSLLFALGLVGFFLLITACVNFVNMATAQALTRVREVGVRKSLGSTRNQLFWQFMLETGLIVTAALGIGLLLARLGLPFLNEWLQETLAFDEALWRSLALFLLGLGVLLTFLAGFYPGFMQARFNTASALKGSMEAPRGSGFVLRRLLVGTQFAISQMLIISAAVISLQMRYARDADWGFRKGAVLTLDIPEHAQRKALQTQIQQIAGVQNVSLCYQPPASSSNNQTGVFFDNRSKPEQWLVNYKPADAHYLETFGLQLVAGRNLQPSDTVREFLINETFAKKLNLATAADALQKRMNINGSTGEIVGVVRDFHNWEIAQPISAIAFSTMSGDYGTCAVQLAPGTPDAALAQIRKAWENLFPNHVYEHQFMEEQIGEFLEVETIMLRLVNTFAGIAVFIGCLGLYGLAAFMVNRKRKEVGIRKALGADIPGILWLFGKEYTRLILLAFVLAAPIAWWAMDSWLSDYAYRISIGMGIFALSLLLCFAIAMLTVGIQSARAALANPVQALRSE